ncbi:hypothetical protein RHMOL_Rhmol07G0129200 [Rhododendron molle]|uniref:Uncharacterized protein n=1 Tax=Rhododendron molle TaxID=49168 RepID=A0ACC0N125_RHOML|nr:hypothetical protein RHMOL_Rhmol07G0129200 [Rhododendron molle]
MCRALASNALALWFCKEEELDLVCLRNRPLFGSEESSSSSSDRVRASLDRASPPHGRDMYPITEFCMLLSSL